MATWKKVLTKTPSAADLGASASDGYVLTAQASSSSAPVWEAITTSGGDVTGITAGDGIRIENPETSTPDIHIDFDENTTGLEGTAIATTDVLLYMDSDNSDDMARGLVSDLPFDASGTDNSTDVSLTGSGSYISITGQVITVDSITESDISDFGTYSTATGVENNAKDDQTLAEILTLLSGDLNGDVTIGNQAEDTVIITGHLTVSGTTTTINSATLEVEDKMILLGNVTNPSATTASGGGVHIEASADSSGDQIDYPTIKWTKNSGGGNTVGNGTALGVTGWSISNMQTSNHVLAPVAVIEQVGGTTAPGVSDHSCGIGSFYQTGGNGFLYIRTA